METLSDRLVVATTAQGYDGDEPATEQRWPLPAKPTSTRQSEPS